jgi:hypothetical protein
MLDFYAVPVKTLSFEGRDKMHTGMGLFSTLLTVVMLVGYLAFECIGLNNGVNSTVSVTNRLNQFQSLDDAFELDPNFFFGFGVKSLTDLKFKNDPRVVKWVVDMKEAKNKGSRGIVDETVATFQVKPCDNKDYGKLNKPDSDVVAK